MRTLSGFALAALLAVPAQLSAQSADFSIPAHVSRVDGRALIQRAFTDGAGTDENGDEVLERNLTLTEGDRIRTLSGRVEILFADGTLLHLDRNTIVDFLREDFVRVMEGRARWSVPRRIDRRDDVVRVDTPAATLELEPGGEFRIGVAPNGDTELAVRRGSGAVLNDHGDTPLRAGERAVVTADRAPSQALYANAALSDDFDLWTDARLRSHASAASQRYLPNELYPYGSVFDSYGSWRSHPTHGYVWYPVADSGWQPYSYGRWHSYPRYGWTWIGNDPWAWPTHHFGRWGFSAGAWYWIPGRHWSPAWVAWGSSPGYVGWSPLGWDNRPLFGLNINIGNRYSAGYPWCGWTFIRERHFGGRWGRPDVFIGTSVAVVARGGGIQEVARAPIAGRARPRNGVLPGTAVPRGTAAGRTGNGGGTSEAGIGGVPASRPRRIPTETIRSAPSTPGRTVTPREGEQPREGTARPRSGGEPSTPAAGRPVRPRSGGGDAPAQLQSEDRPAVMRRAPREESAPAVNEPAYRAPRVRGAERPESQSPRAAERDSQPRASERPSQSPAPSYRSREPQPRGGDRPSESPRAAQPRERPSAPAAPSAGGGSQPRGGDRRAPSQGGSSSSGSQARRRGGS